MLGFNPTGATAEGGVYFDANGQPISGANPLAPGYLPQTMASAPQINPLGYMPPNQQQMPMSFNTFGQVPQAPAFAGAVAPYDLPGTLPGAPQSMYNPFAALESMQRQPIQSVQNPVFGGAIPIDFSLATVNQIPQGFEQTAVKEYMENIGQAGKAPTAGPQPTPTGAQPGTAPGSGTIVRPVVVQPGQPIGGVMIGDTGFRSDYHGNSGALIPYDGRYIDSRTGQDYTDFVSPLDQEYANAVAAGDTQRTGMLDLIRGSVFETLINQDSGYVAPVVNLAPQDVFVPAQATPTGQVEAPYVLKAVQNPGDSGTFFQVAVPLDEYVEPAFDWLAMAGSQN
jgi:hypothetical protein